MSTITTSAATAPEPRRMTHNQGLWLLASLIVTFLGASSAPSPLYAVYRQAWGFSALTLTLIFSVYAFTLLGALLVFGALSDYRGRREVILGALVLQIGATLLFRHAESVAWLFAARAVQGLATGIATGALSAGLLDFHRERGALLNSVAPMFGMAVGAVGTSALVQFAPAPTHLVFDVLLAAFGLQAIGVSFLPETVMRRPLAWRALKPTIQIPAQARPTLWTVMPLAGAQWALGGFYLSLGPTLASVITGSKAPLMGGAMLGVLLMSAAASVFAFRQRPARTALAAGAAGLALGLAVTLLGMHAHSVAVFFVGTAIAGIGFGATFNSSLRSIVPLAAPHERAGLMSSFFVLAYLGFSVPTVAVGLAAGRFGLFAAATWYGAMLVALFSGALVMILRRRVTAD